MLVHSGFQRELPLVRNAANESCSSPVAVHITWVLFSRSIACRRLGASTFCHMVSLVIHTASGACAAISEAFCRARGS